MRIPTFPVWSGKFFSVNVALLGRTVLHLIPKFKLIALVSACKVKYNHQIKPGEVESLYSFSTGIGKGLIHELTLKCRILLETDPAATVKAAAIPADPTFQVRNQ